jgi:hypothetical protein
MPFHVSEDGGIQRFEPRVSAHGESLVWAIDGGHLRNYLLPRDCPRVTYYAGRQTTATAQRRVDVRVLPELWALHDAIVASTLQFSMIRMRNALPRLPAS